MIIFPSHPSFKTLLPLSITWRSFRSVAWSNAPQRCTWNRGHTRLIHHFPPTIASPAPPITPPKCSSFMHAPVSFHSCSFSLLYRSPPLLPHFLAFSHSFITEGIYPPNAPHQSTSSLTPRSVLQNTTWPRTYINYATARNIFLVLASKKSMADMDKFYISKWSDACYYFIVLNLHF